MMDKAETPLIIPASGSFFSSQQVTITCATNGAIIRYTTDGNMAFTNYWYLS